MRLLYCEDDPFDSDALQAKPESIIAGVGSRSCAYSFPLTRRDMLRRLVHLYEVDLECRAAEAHEARRANRALWAHSSQRSWK
ncbi:unnamed protein product [Prorocentrum cordatum]|uniref:Uncharacterized protein n=1 Tax=Prorocentrum cordatum TaxID=2364126 RepID=A0ABN9TWF1_9DINO|nr:unnamed protein product [Polarella glacialis]